ncbi:uncharacterized protein KY384_005056 [Bacidia gigantensis]|uniref:uncharacterized protein n=1 Tax=Bacidia gigantensis TaxID=2732470 RepID=UPI001D054F1C|nr:uncharacterized protein KY384_005056 [Bacidia gigantensis]KAG8530553.1 hypothetical protein KY384_005056 [Bacidia gigantensis]
MTPQILFQDSRNTSLTEPQPEEFHCEFSYKKGGTAIPSVETLVFLVGALSQVAILEYQLPISQYSFNDPGLTVLLRSSKAPDHDFYRAKHILWSLRITACYMFSKEHWGEIGFFSRYALPSSSPGQETPLRIQRTGIRSLWTNSNSPPKDPTFKPYDIFITIINILVSEGELDAEAPQGHLSGYNREADLSVGMECTSRASVENFTNRIAVEAFTLLAEFLPTVEEKLRWKGVQFVVRNQGKIVGRGIVRKGVIPRRGDGTFDVGWLDDGVEDGGLFESPQVS